jgi:hypothetical protein
VAANARSMRSIARSARSSAFAKAPSSIHFGLRTMALTGKR